MSGSGQPWPHNCRDGASAPSDGGQQEVGAGPAGVDSPHLAF